MMQDPNAAAAIHELRERCDRLEKLCVETVAGIGIVMDRMCWDDLGRQFAERVMPLMAEIKKAKPSTSGEQHG